MEEEKSSPSCYVNGAHVVIVAVHGFRSPLQLTVFSYYYYSLVYRLTFFLSLQHAKRQTTRSSFSFFFSRQRK